jgi:NAD(P)H-dependent FMN reductase
MQEHGHGNVKKQLLIVWHSVTGGSRQMAQAAAEAAQGEAGVAVRVRQADAAEPGDLLDADGYLFACPENLGSMSGPMKSFFDRSYYPVLDRIQGRPYASLICAGSDGSGAARQIERIATGWRLRAVAPPLIVCTQAQTPERILAPKTIGASAAASSAPRWPRGCRWESTEA